MRRVLRAVVSGWLLCQLVAIVSPLALSCDAFGLDSVDCCDNLEPGAVCPMHHHAVGDRTCRMSSACGHRDATLLTIVPVGLLPSLQTPSSSIAVPSADAIEESTIARAFTPDLPPPRLIGRAALQGL